MKYYRIDKYPELYLDWVNNFITVERFAEYYGMSVKQAEDIIKIGRASDNFTKCIDWNALIEK